MGSQDLPLHHRRQWGYGRGRRPYAQTTTDESPAQEAASTAQRPRISPEPSESEEEGTEPSITDDSAVYEPTTSTSTSSYSFTPTSSRKTALPHTPSPALITTQTLMKPSQTTTDTSTEPTSSSTTPPDIVATKSPKPEEKPKTSSKSRTTRTSSQYTSDARVSSAKSKLSKAYSPPSSGAVAPTSLAVPISSDKSHEPTASQDSATSLETTPSDLATPAASSALASIVASTDMEKSSSTTSATSSVVTSSQMSSSYPGSQNVYSAVSLYGAAPLLPQMDVAPPTQTGDIAVATKAGIAVGTVCLGSALLGLAIFYFRRQRKGSDDSSSYKRSSTPSMTCVDGKDALYHENGDYYPATPSTIRKLDDLRYSTVIDAWAGDPNISTQVAAEKPLNVKVIEPGRSINRTPSPVPPLYPKMLNPGSSLGGRARKVSAFSDSIARASWDTIAESPRTLNWQHARSGLGRLLRMSRVTSLSSASDPAFPVSARAKNFPMDDNMFLKVPTTAVVRDSFASSQASSASHYPGSVRTANSRGLA